MGNLKVSVLIPTYLGAGFLAETVQSVLDQTYPHFELIVVNDCSPDDTDAVMARFDDPRIQYLVHEKNRGPNAARVTGLQVATGEVIALLDHDDRFHPEKLATHVRFYERDPELGCTVNGRFDVDHQTGEITGIWHPPSEITLADLVLGFPFAPSDTLLRRDWALREDIWDDYYVDGGPEVIVNGGEIVIFGRMFLAGCKFANVNRPLNYRSYHAQRMLSNLPLRCRSERACQEIILSDPRCPAEVRALRSEAFKNSYLIWAYFAVVQEEYETARTFLCEAIRQKPALLDGHPCELVVELADFSVQDHTRDHEALLDAFFAHLPPEAAGAAGQKSWALARSSLLKGFQALLWNRQAEGERLLCRASSLGLVLDAPIIGKLTYELLNYEAAMGREAAERARSMIIPFLEKIGGAPAGREFQATYLVNRAFENNRRQQFRAVPPDAVQAIAYQPRLLMNRGVISILVRSLLGAK